MPRKIPNVVFVLSETFKAERTKASTEQEQILGLAETSKDPVISSDDLEKRLKDVTVGNDEILDIDREIIINAHQRVRHLSLHAGQP